MPAGERCRRAVCGRTARTARCGGGRRPTPVGSAARRWLPPADPTKQRRRETRRDLLPWASRSVRGSRSCGVDVFFDDPLSVENAYERITVKQVVETQELADAEVGRLYALANR